MNGGRETSQLSEARRALIAKRLQGGSTRANTSIDVLPADAPRPASSAQLRLYLLDQLYPGNSAYHICLALRLRGALDRDALGIALDTVVGRHDALRTRFVSHGSHLEQVLDPPGTVTLTRHGNRTETEIIAVVNTPFDLETGPLFRADLFECGENDHLLVLTVHHIVSDEWSMANLRAELGSAYDAAVAGTPVQLQPLPIQYADYAAWQNRRGDERAAAQLDYWRNQLDGASTGLDLPYDAPRPVKPRFRGELRQLQLRPGLDDAIAKLAQEAGATPFMVWLAALNALLYRYTAQTDICIGTPVANRPTAEIEPLIGMFLNSLVIRTCFDGATSFTSLIAQVKDAVVDAFANQDLPFDALVAELQQERDLSHNPMFQTMLVMEQLPGFGDGFSGLDVSRVEFDTGHAKLDLTVFVRATAQGPLLSAEYDSDLFVRDSIDAFLRRLGHIVEQIKVQPTITLDRISLVTEQDPPAKLHSPAGPTRWRSVLDAFAAAVALDPKAVAILAAGVELSYGELDAMSNRIANALAARGIGAGHLVPVRIARSPEQVAAMLGVLKSGAAYVPLDPDYPTRRHQRIVDQLRDGSHTIGPLLSVAALAADDFGLDVLPVEALADGAYADTAPAVDIDSDDLAYIIHTSGSSGQPKGVTISHANLAAGTAARFDYYREPPARFLLVSSFAFDSSVAGTYWTLLAGGTLVLAPPDSTPDPRELGRLIERTAVTHTLMLPGLYDLLLDTNCDLTTLHTVIVAGEACTSKLVRKHYMHLVGARLFNEYGPTEATVWSSVYECQAETANDVPIGTAIPGAQLCVVDAHGDLVPAGIPGELYVGGAGIAKGYLDAPELTAERFVDNERLGRGRLYRTGDRVRLDSQGQLRFLGRLDDQVKIRGFRVETGEIEAQLRSASAVTDAAVIPEYDQHGHAVALIAYVAPASVSTVKLAESLRENIPDYMLPRAIIALEGLPHTPSGKLDRQQLSTLNDTPAAMVPQPLEDETAVALAELWRRLLGVDDVGADDDFFALGGHSLMGMSLMIEIERRFGVSLPLSALFESSRLAALATLVQQTHVAQEQHFVTALREDGSRTPLFCIHAGARLIVEHLPEDQPVYLVYQRIGELDPETNSVESIAQQYLNEMRTIRPHGPYALIGFSAGAQIAFEMAQRLRADGETIDALLLGDPPLHSSSAYYQRRLSERFDRVQHERGLLRKAIQGTRQIALLAWRRVDSLRLRLLAAYFERTRGSFTRLRRGAWSLVALGAALWIGGGLWMNAPHWRPAIVPLETGAEGAATFTAPVDSTYELQLEVEHNVGQPLLRSQVLTLNEPSPLDIRWQLSNDSRPRLAGDVRDYLYLERGPVSLLGHLRRIAMRVPFGQSRLYFNSFGLLGNAITARGLASFEVAAGETLTLTTVTGDVAAVAAGNPRLVVRQSRKTYADHYARVTPLMFAGIGFGVLGLLLLAIAVWRERQGVPADVLRFLERRHLQRISNAYDYRPYDGELTLLYPGSSGEHLNQSQQFWNRLTGGRVRVELIVSAERHLDFVRSRSSAEIAHLLDKLLGQARD